MRAKCYACRSWDKKEGKFHYKMADETDWIPHSGYDPDLRGFKCPFCGDVFYKRLTDEELRLSGWLSDIIKAEQHSS